MATARQFKTKPTGRPARPLMDSVDTSGDCWLWTGAKEPRGYGHVIRKVDGKRTLKLAHRLVFEEYNGPIPAGLVVRHKCDNPSCVKPDHLELGTSADNNADCRDRGRARWALGEAVGSAKLTADQIADIRETYAQGGVSQAELGRQHGVIQQTVHQIVRNKTWRHV